MDVVQLGSKLLMEKLGISGNGDAVAQALSGLLGGADGRVDLAALVSRLMSQGDLKNVVGSWLGDGANAGISASQISGLFGSDKLAGFAAKVGVSESAAADGLAAVLPQLIDKSSSGGGLLGAVGGAGGPLGTAKKLF